MKPCTFLDPVRNVQISLDSELLRLARRLLWNDFTFTSWEPLSNASHLSFPPPLEKHILNTWVHVFKKNVPPRPPCKLHFIDLVQLSNNGPFWLKQQFPFINHVFLDCQFLRNSYQTFPQIFLNRDCGPLFHLGFPQDHFYCFLINAKMSGRTCEWL